MNSRYIKKVINVVLFMIISSIMLSCAKEQYLHSDIVSTILSSTENETSLDSLFVEDTDYDEIEDISETLNDEVVTNNIQDINELFYAKNDKAYVIFDGKEYEICEVDGEYQKFYNNEVIYYVENDDIFYALFKHTKDNKNKLYSIKNNNGNVKINLLLESSIDKKEKLEFLYKNLGNLYFSKFDIETIANKEKCTGSIIEIHNGKVNYLYSNIAINNRNEDMLYYSKNIDTVFYISKNKEMTTYTINSIKKGETKVIYDDASLIVAESLRVIATVDGIYYNQLTDNGIAFYDGEEHMLTNDVFIREIRKTTSNNMFYIITNTHKTINLDDYIDSSSYPNSVKKELDGIDTTKMNMITQDLYAVCAKDIKLIGKNVNLTPMLKLQGEYVLFYSKANSFDGKIRYVEFKDSIKDNKWAMARPFTEQIERHLNDFLYKKNEYVYIYKGFEGTRLNFQENVLKGCSDYLIDNNKIYYTTSQIGNLYVGEISYNEVTNLEKVSDNDKYSKITNASDKIFLEKQYDYGSSSYDSKYDWYIYDDDKEKLISKDEKGSLKVYTDLDDNIYVFNEENGIYSYDLNTNSLDLIITSNNKQKISVVYDINSIKSIDTKYQLDKNTKENFYIENPNEYIKSIKKSNTIYKKEEDNTNKDNLDNLDSKMFKVENYNALSSEYINGSKKYYVEKKEVDRNIVFYRIWNKDEKYYDYYVNIEKNGELSKVHIADFVKDKNVYHRPEYILHDELLDLYYYEVSKKSTDYGRSCEIQVYELKINNDNSIDENLKTSKVFEENEYNYDTIEFGLRYLGKLGKYDIYITGKYNIYADDGENFKLIGQTESFSFQNMDKVIALNSYENRLYYLNYNYLCEIDANLNKKTISDHVVNFISLQNELFYSTNFMYRYHDGKSERLFETSQYIKFIGRHNDDKFYILEENDNYVKDKYTFDSTNASKEMRNAWEEVKNRKLFYPYGNNTFSIYKNGEFTQLVENCKLIGDYDNRYLENLFAHPLLVATSNTEGYLSFNEFYNVYIKQINNNKIISEMCKYKQDIYIINVDEFDLSKIKVTDIFVNDNDYTISTFVKNLQVKDRVISFQYNKKNYYIDFSEGTIANGELKQNRSNIKLSKDDEIMPIFNLGYYIRN